MIQITNIVKDAYHDSTYRVNRPNGHPSYLLLLVKTPCVFLIDDEWVPIAEGTAFLFKPYQQHRYYAKGSCYIDDWAHITSSQPLLNEHFPFGKPIVLHNQMDYYNLFHVIYNEYFSKTSHHNMIMNNLILALLDKLFDECNSIAYPDLYYKFLTLREQMLRSPEKQWNVPMLSQELNITAGYFHSLYKRYFNSSCLNDLIEQRIKNATELLLSTNLSIEEIAFQCGYRHTEHFIRQFNTHMKISPNRFRKEISAR